MKTSSAFVLGLSLAAVMMGTRPAGACSCFSDIPPEDLFASADAVFRGTPLSYVIEGEGFDETYVYSFQVTACWKGDVDEIIELRTLVNEAACGVFIPPGLDVLVYASTADDHYEANLCTVFYVGNAQNHLDWLGEPTCSTVSVDPNTWGSVKALYR